MTYDAFISYSHAADGLLAPRLQDGLQRFAKPWWRRRSLRVFRDQTGLSVNPHLWSSVAAAMDESRYFVLLASPEAAASEWVNREIEYWRTHKNPAHILPVLTDGELVWDPAANDLDLVASTAVPAALAGVFAEEPRHLDMRWARGDEQLDLRDGRFRDQVAELAAPIHGVAKDDLAGADVRQHRRTLRTALAAGIALVLLALASAGAAVAAARNADQANHNETVALTEQSLAITNAHRAQVNLGEASRNATKARKAQDQADANAAQAQTNAQAAQQAQGQAEQSADQAQRNAASAQASAAQAHLEQEAAQQSAAQAALSQQAAEAAKAATDRLNAELQSTNADLATSNQNLDAEKQALSAQNQALSDANGQLDSQRLVALAEAERAAGNYDTAMLLANQAIAVATTDPTPARDEAFAIQQQARFVQQYLPGPTVGATPVFSHDRLADPSGDSATGTVGNWQIWNLAHPDQAPVTLDTAALGQGLAAVFSHDGSRVFIPIFATSTTGPAVGIATLWDTTTGALLWQATVDPMSATGAVVSPDGRSMAVAESGHVVVIDLDTLAVVATWSGSLATDFFSDTGCVSTTVGAPQPLTQPQCDFSPDSRYLLGWSAADGAWVLWDTQHPSQTTTLYTPTGFGTGEVPLPQFASGGATRVLGVPTPDTLVGYAPDGTAAPALTLPGGSTLAQLAVGADGSSVAVLDAAGDVLRLDLAANTLTAVAHLPTCATTLGLSRQSTWVVASSETETPDCPGLTSVWYVPLDGSASARGPFSSLPVAFGQDAAGHETTAIGQDGNAIDLASGFPTNLGELGSGCVVAADGSRVVCGSRVIELAPFEPFGAGPTDVGVDATHATFDDTGSTLYEVTATGRVAVVDPSRTAVGSPLYSGSADQVFGATGPVLSPDGTHLVVATSAGASLVTLAGGATTALPVAPGALVVGASFSPDGGRLYLRSLQPGPDFDTANPTEVIDLGTDTVVGTLAQHVVASGDGAVLATWNDGDPAVQLVDAATLAPRGSVAIGSSFSLGPEGNQQVALDQDGSQVAVAAGPSPTVEVLDATTDTVTRQVVTGLPLGFSGPASVAFSPDGQTLAVADMDESQTAGAATVDLASGKVTEVDVVATACFDSGGDTAVPPLEFSPDGHLLEVGGQLLELATLAPVGTSLGCSPGSFAAGAFVDGGQAFDYATEAPSVDLTHDQIAVGQVSLDPAVLSTEDCTVAGRNFTAAEWARFEPGLAYRSTCPQWPAGT